MENLTIAYLVGKTLIAVDVNNENDVIQLKTSEGEIFQMYHEQDCCESVYVEDIIGDLSDLIGSPIVAARERTSDDLLSGQEFDDSHTWTFYRLSTNKGTVTIRWYGSSNGYYSESVDFIRVAQ
jgi:hypothetical protein